MGKIKQKLGIKVLKTRVRNMSRETKIISGIATVLGLVVSLYLTPAFAVWNFNIWFGTLPAEAKFSENGGRDIFFDLQNSGELYGILQSNFLFMLAFILYSLVLTTLFFLLTFLVYFGIIKSIVYIGKRIKRAREKNLQKQRLLHKTKGQRDLNELEELSVNKMHQQKSQRSLTCVNCNNKLLEFDRFCIECGAYTNITI